MSEGTLSAQVRTLGRSYMVQAVHVIRWRGFRDMWLPVIGPKHEDAEIIGFKWQHWHLDWRFVAKRVFDWMCSIRGTEYVYASVIQEPDSVGNQVVDRGPELKRMTYKRDWPAYPHGVDRWQTNLAEHYACATLIAGKCPHRGIPLSEMKREGDVLTCPGHGLRWCARTGQALPPPPGTRYTFHGVRP